MTDFDNGDRTGIGAMGRARDMRFRQSLQGLGDYHPAGAQIDPRWDAYFQNLDEQGVDNIQAGESPEGSNQLTGFGNTQVINRKGFSQAPLTGLQTIANTPVSSTPVSATPTVHVAPTPAVPMPMDHETFMANLAAEYARKHKGIR